jgi:hypothetical protein
MLRGDCRDRQGFPDEAIRLYRQALERDENRVGPSARDRIRRIRERG